MRFGYEIEKKTEKRTRRTGSKKQAEKVGKGRANGDEVGVEMWFQ